MMRGKVAILSIVAILLVSFLGLAFAPANASGVANWSVQFYNSSNLAGNPVLTRQDSAIAFDWGAGSPGANVNADLFSARWASDPFFASGRYRFFARADDSVRVWVDFQPIIDTWGAPRVNEVLTADISLSTGNHHVQVDYREDMGAANVSVSWADLATNPGGPNFSSPVNQPAPVSGPWTAQYWSNSALSGSPTLIQSESNPGHNWGSGAPIVSMPADNFSARWTSTPILAAGNYQITVSVDDGARVFVDGVSVINVWHLATGTPSTANVNLSAGAHNVVVEYFEAGGVAFLHFNMVQLNPPAPPPPPQPTGPTATVTAFRLNVRNAPDPINGAILLRISRGESYPIVGRNAEGSWWQLNVNGTVGWVNAGFVSAANATNVPVTGASAPPPTQAPAPSGAVATVSAFRLNVRNAPDPFNGAIVTRVSRGETYAIVGRNADASWWQINVNGVIGWVNALFVSAVNTSNVPVTGTTTSPTSAPSPTGYTVTATPFTVNIRSGPGTGFNILGRLLVNQNAQVLGRNQDATWWHVNYNGVVGWVTAQFAPIQAGADLNRIPVTG